MPNRRCRVVVMSGLIMSCVLVGCGEESKPVSEPVVITPGMEKMKQEMISGLKTNKMKTGAKKAPGAAKSRP